MERLVKVSEERNRKLNKIEALKSKRSAMEAFHKIEEYARNGFASIPEGDRNYFLKCFGIVNMPTEPGRFMVRLRIPGGVLSWEQAKKVGEIANQYGRGCLDLTTRMQAEFHYVKIEDMPILLKELENIGITTFQTGVDNFRNIVCDPLSGETFDSVIDTGDILLELQDVFLKKPEWIGQLPRKVNIGISGSFINRCNILNHDICFVLAERDGIYGFNVYLGGKVGAVAMDADIFLKDKEKVVLFFTSIAKVYNKYGFRDMRAKCRIKHLIDAAGMESLVDAVKKEADNDFLPAGQVMMNTEEGHRRGKVLLRDRTFALHMVIPAGIFSGTDMIEAADIASKFGKGKMCLTVEQNLYILGVKEEAIEDVLSLPIYEKYKHINTPYYNDLVACPGSEQCNFGMIATKSGALEMADYLSRVIPLKEGKIRLYWSGCPNGCGIHGVGDIGFTGVKFNKGNGVTEGVNIFLGGAITEDCQEGKRVLKSIPLQEARYYVEEIVFLYQQLRKKNESFERFYKRVLAPMSVPALRFLITFNYMVKRRFNLEQLRLRPEGRALHHHDEKIEIMVFGMQLYKKLTGKNPYNTDSLCAIYGDKFPPTPSVVTGQHVPAFFNELVLKMIQRDPGEQYQSLTGVIEDLENNFSPVPHSVL